jgi:hypothetical protein
MVVAGLWMVVSGTVDLCGSVVGLTVVLSMPLEQPMVFLDIGI